MAGDINKIINGLTSIKPKFEKLAKNNDLISVIDDLNDIIDDAAQFGGVVAQTVPVSLRSQVEALTGIYNQLKSISKSAQEVVEQQLNTVDSIPIGQLRKKSLKSIADSEDDESSYEEPRNSIGGIAPTQRESLAFDDDNAAKDYMKEHQSYSLSNFYKDTFKENKNIEKTKHGAFNFEDYRTTFAEHADKVLGNSLNEAMSSRYDNSAINRIKERAESYNEAIVNDDNLQLDESAPLEAFNWKKMAESSANSLSLAALATDSIIGVDDVGRFDIGDAAAEDMGYN
jgi:hypothetical protein